MNLNRGRRLLAHLALLASIALTGCGGGGVDVAGVDSGGTGSFAVGTIAGFGSVIVNDIRYDDSGAIVQDAYGMPRAATDLRLGMLVEIEGSVLADAPAGSLHSREGTASEIRIGAQIIGPLQSVDAAASQVVVLGQVLDLTTATVYGDELAGGMPTLASLPAGSVLEVHGFPSAANEDRYTATRVDLRVAADEYRLIGIVRNLDTVGRRFIIGGAQIDYAAIGTDEAQAAGVTEGGLARVRLGTVPREDGTWPMLQAQPAAPQLPDREDVDIEGPVTRFTAVTDFDVNGVPVDASGASIDQGSGQILLGARVTVVGSLSGGVLVAEVVRLDDDETPAAGPGGKRISLRGPVAALSADSQQMRVRGVRVNIGSATFEGGSLADLRNGITVEVDGRLAVDGSSVDASWIRIRADRGATGSPGSDDSGDDSPGNRGSNGNPGSSGAPSDKRRQRWRRPQRWEQRQQRK